MKILLLILLVAFPFVSSANICAQLRYVIDKVRRNSSVPSYTESSHSLAECGVKLHKQANFNSAVFTKENTCEFYSDITPEDNLVTAKGSVYINKVCTASACDDCWYRKLNGDRTGTYEVRINGHQHLVFCDMDTDGGGWTVFQRRIDGSVDFHRNWTSYKQGFGDVAAEHWLGNNLLSALTARGPHELRIDLVEFSNDTAYAKYSSFSVDPEANKYTLHVSGYKGTAGDGLVPNEERKVVDDRPFSTYDRDSDRWSKNCAQDSGAWWHNDCSIARLNGPYTNGISYSCVVWSVWKNKSICLKGSVMMLRPII